MSRLATLCSLKSSYIDAMKNLQVLYITRGYPTDLVLRWLKDNIQERWHKRLSEDRREPAELLVLKSEFNTAWDYFNATELGETILGYWRTWLTKADSGDFSLHYPCYTSDVGKLYDTPAELKCEVFVLGGKAFIPDARKINILNRRMLVSKKRTRNLFDLTGLWKNIVLATLDQDAVTHGHNPVYISESSDSDSDMDSDRIDPAVLFDVIGYR